MKLAAEYYNRSEIESSIPLYAKAKSRFEQAGDFCEAEVAGSWVGYGYARLADAEKCIALFDQLGKVFTRNRHKSLLTYSLNAIADAYTSRDEFSKAIEYARRSLRMAQDMKDVSGTLRNLSTLQSMNWHLGKYEECLKLGLEALSLADALTLDPKQIWPIYNLTSLSLLALGNPAAALAAQQEALQVSGNAQWPIIKSLSHAHLGLIYGDLNDHREAIRHGQLSLQEGEKIAGEITRRNIIASSQVYLGSLKYNAGDYSGAIASYDQAIPLCEETAAQFYLFNTHKGKFLACLAMGDERSAGRELESAIKLARRYRSRILEESNKNAFFDAGQDIYDSAIDFEYSRRRNIVNAFQYSEESRARSLLDARQKGAQIVKWEKEVELRLPDAAEHFDLETIRNRLPKKSLIVQYAVLPKKVIIWVVSANGLAAAERSISADELDAKVVSYLRLVLSSVSGAEDDANKKAKELYDLLITPIRPLLDRSNLVCIVPDKILHHLPFPALISPTSNRYLVEEYTTTVSPSATTFTLCSATAEMKKGNRDERLLSVGDPKIDYAFFPGLQEIAASKDEAERVASFYRSPHLLVEADAKEAVVRKLINEVDVVHLASHSIVDENTPLLSKLLLTPSASKALNSEATDGFLHAYELYESKLDSPRLVVLSACRTGSGKAYQGEGVISLTRPFIAAGVPMVVASLWNVESATTAEIMVKFHLQRRRNRLPAAEALKATQLEMLHSKQRIYSKPSTWAAFIIVGGSADF